MEMLLSHWPPSHTLEGWVSLRAGREKVGPEIPYIIMVDMLKHLPHHLCSRERSLDCHIQLGRRKQKSTQSRRPQEKAPRSENRNEETEKYHTELEAEKLLCETNSQRLSSTMLHSLQHI